MELERGLLCHRNPGSDDENPTRPGETMRILFIVPRFYRDDSHDCVFPIGTASITLANRWQYTTLAPAIAMTSFAV